MTNDRSSVRKAVRQRYGQIALEFAEESSASCCGPQSKNTLCCDTSPSVAFYNDADVASLPDEVSGLSLGCGDPVTLASLKKAQVVLDLGSGGGIDCFLAAKKVGAHGRVIGVDMTPEMLERARASQERMGLDNVEFRLGEIEHLPVENEIVDVVISNCVINLSTDKRQVFREVFRVLRPGGQLAVSDMVAQGPLPDEVKESLSAWAGCIAGAPDIDEYVEAVKSAGFVDIEIEPVILDRELVDQALEELEGVVDRSTLDDQALYSSVVSARLTARKPE